MHSLTNLDIVILSTIGLLLVFGHALQVYYRLKLEEYWRGISTCPDCGRGPVYCQVQVFRMARSYEGWLCGDDLCEYQIYCLTCKKRIWMTHQEEHFAIESDEKGDWIRLPWREISEKECKTSLKKMERCNYYGYGLALWQDLALLTGYGLLVLWLFIRFLLWLVLTG